jgi:hypothetical protein
LKAPAVPRARGTAGAWPGGVRSDGDERALGQVPRKCKHMATYAIQGEVLEIFHANLS